jgi:hypothetical protein
LITVPEADASKYKSGNLLQPVFENGDLLVRHNWDDIVARARS